MGQLIYKDIGIEDEGSYGASAAGTAARVHVISLDLNLNPTKELIEDTTSNVKGRDRIERIKNVIEGSINAMGTPRAIHHLTELGMGITATETAVGSSSTLYTYNQNVSGTMLSKTINVDRSGKSQEKFQGIVGREIEFKASDNKLEVSLSATGKGRVAGVSMVDTGTESTRPFTFADFSIVIGATLNSFTAGVTTLKISDWTVTYNNDHEVAFLSGSYDAQRADPKIPSLTGKFTIFHENDGLVNGTFGNSEYALRFEAVSTGNNGLIAGATPYLLRIDIPRAQLMTNVRNYEQNSLSIEEVEFVGLFESGSSALLTVTQTADLGM